MRKSSRRPPSPTVDQQTAKSPHEAKSRDRPSSGGFTGKESCMTLSNRDPKMLAPCVLARRVYLYWRKEQALSRLDARAQVEAFMKKRALVLVPA